MKAKSWVAYPIRSIADGSCRMRRDFPLAVGGELRPDQGAHHRPLRRLRQGLRHAKGLGIAALIEYGGKRILFDTGNNPEILAQNTKAKGIDLSKLDFAIMSHRHGDHMGGLAYLLSVNPKVKIYAPKEGFGVYGADLPSTFYRKDASLPPAERYYDGAPPTVMRFGAAWPGAKFELIDKTTEITPASI